MNIIYGGGIQVGQVVEYADFTTLFPTGSFSRASIAYDPVTGTQVASGVPRYGTGRFGNLLTAADSCIASIADFGNRKGDTTALSLDSTVTNNGYSSLKVVTAGALNDGWYLKSNCPAVTPGLTYTGSAYVKGDGVTQFQIFLEFLDGNGANLGHQGSMVTFTPTTSFARYSTIPVAAPTNAVTVRMTVWVNSATVTTYWSTQLQIEQGSLTDWRLGGSGQALFIEEGTTNLLNANQSDAETDTSGFQTQGSGTINLSRDTAYAWHGSASLKVVTDGSANFQGFSTTNVGVTASQTYTASAYVRGSGTVMIILQEVDGNNIYIGQTTATAVTLTGNWQRITVTRTFGATGVNARVQVVTTSAQAVTFWVDGLQLEQKSGYATSWVLGGTTRAPETLTVPTAGLTPTAGTIECWVYVNSTVRRQVSGQFPTIIEIPRANANATGIFLFHNNTTAQWQFQTRDDAGVTASVLFPDAVTPDGWHHFAIRWSTAEAAVFVDGIRQGVITSPNLPSGFGATMYVGYRGTAQNSWLNSWVDELKVSTAHLSDAQILADYNSTKPNHTDANTLIMMNFDNNLNSHNDVNMVLQNNTLYLRGQLIEE